MEYLVRGNDWHDLKEFLAAPYRDWSARYPGRRAFGYLCTYAPLEMLHAAGLTPLRLIQLPGTMALADAHLPSFSCALARAVTERMLRKELDFLEGVLFAHTCDTMQCLADIWRMATPDFRVITFSLPTVLNSPAAFSYLVEELRHLAMVLESEFGLPVVQDALRASIATYNEQRRLLSALYAHARQLSAEQLWSFTLAGMLMPVEEHNTILRLVLQEAATSQYELPLHAERSEASRSKASQPHEREIPFGLAQDRLRCAQNNGLVSSHAGPAVILVGAVLDDPFIPQLIEELGAQVVGDDLCTGSRYFDVLVDESKEPFVALAERYQRRAPCPAKHVAGDSRAQRLLSMLGSSRAQGVIFVLPKFCDPHAFDYVPLSKALADGGVPHLLLETDVTSPVGQLRTRVQAFIEMLNG